MKRERFFAQVYKVFKRDSFPDNCIDWTNENVSLEHETMNVCQKNVARFVHV